MAPPWWCSTAVKIHPTIGVLVCLGSGERQRCTHTHTHTCVQQGKEMALRNADFKLLLGKAAAGGSSQQTASQGPEAAGPSSRGHQATAAPGVSMGPPGALPSKPGSVSMPASSSPSSSWVVVAVRPASSCVCLCGWVKECVCVSVVGMTTVCGCIHTCVCSSV